MFLYEVFDCPLAPAWYADTVPELLSALCHIIGNIYLSIYMSGQTLGNRVCSW